MNARSRAERGGLPPARRRAGFTLVELLVAMTVLALVSLTMMGGMRFVFRAFAHTDQRREALEELTLGFAVLRNEVEMTLPLMRKAGGRELVLFEGGPDRLRFVNVMPAHKPGPPYVAHEFAMVADSGGNRIELRRTPFDPSEPDLAVVAAGEARTLVRVTRPLRFTYYGRLKERETPAWHETWPRGAMLPQAIRLAEGDDPGWPELVMPLMIRAPWYCGIPDPPSKAGCAPETEDKARPDDMTTFENDPRESLLNKAMGTAGARER